ncbi:hypothetical protein BDW22DRAFT_1304847, partial [Trametopsis cervina]
LVKALRVEWNEMSKAEQMEVTAGALEKLEEVREMKNTATHNVAINAYHDVRGTMASINTQLENLHHRTGVEILIVGARSQSSSFMLPFAWSTSDRLDEHFQMQFKVSTAQYAAQMECFLLSGMEGTVTNYQNKLLMLKQKTAQLIFEKLQLIARPDKVARMYYRDFDVHITNKFGIILENWPLKTFTSPGNVGSRVELDTLFHAWESGATRFRRLSPADLETW